MQVGQEVEVLKVAEPALEPTPTQYSHIGNSRVKQDIHAGSIRKTRMPK
jgi:hypothetical protein